MTQVITSLALKDVRCFAGKQQAKFSKITLLVGENNTGKSTFLGCLNGIGHLASLVDLDDNVNYFDKMPFKMGAFKTIARSGCASFQIGIDLESSSFSRLEIDFAERPEEVPQENVLSLDVSRGHSKVGSDLKIVRHSSRPSGRWCFTGPYFEFELDQSEASYSQFTTWLSRSVRYGNLPFSGEAMRYKKRMNPSEKDLAAFGKFVHFFRREFHAPSSPFLVWSNDDTRKLGRDGPEHPLEGVDLAALSNAGRDLGLFNTIDVQRVGADKYEILVGINEHEQLHTLIDVGSGVTSVLPLIRALVGESSETLFLLQQPEVHIHPATQSKLVSMMAKSPHRFVVETHSNHMIDWFRILVTEGHLESSDVAIIYFEREPEIQSAVRLHQLTLDDSGNLSGAPHDYRQFFSDETVRLLGLSS